MPKGNTGGQQEFVLDAAREQACAEAVRLHLLASGQSSVERNVSDLCSLGGARGRFEYLTPLLPRRALSRMLVSGCAAGAEMLAGREYGFRYICGSEVQPRLAEIARERLRGYPGFEVVLYDGHHLPYQRGTFSMVVSSHIIEHASCVSYLREQLRVLRRGGFLFLEFPDRYHPTELHTGLPSVEYLPEPLRSLVLRFRASRWSRFKDQEKRYFDEIRLTLRTVSVWQVRVWLKLAGHPSARVLHHYCPAPGFRRLLIQA